MYVTWSMSCWLTTVSPLLKSILASEAKESRDKRHTQTISAVYVYNTVEEPGDNESQCFPMSQWKTWVKTENLISIFSTWEPPGSISLVWARARKLVFCFPPRDPIHSHQGERLTPATNPGLG